jgi:hypothetical protein
METGLCPENARDIIRGRGIMIQIYPFLAMRSDPQASVMK